MGTRAPTHNVMNDESRAACIAPAAAAAINLAMMRSLRSHQSREPKVATKIGLPCQAALRARHPHAIDAYPVCDLPGAPTASTADDGAQLMLWCAPPEGDAYASEVKRRSRCEIDRVPYAGGDSVPDGGMAFRVVDADPLALEASRVVADPDELPKVIREKQLCKKMLAWLEQRVECTSSSLRPVGSGPF